MVWLFLYLKFFNNMKEKILAALKTRYSNLGLSDKAFDGVATLLEKTVTKEEEIDGGISDSSVETLLKTIQSSVDTERTKATKALKDLDEYKKTHPEQTEGVSPELKILQEDLAAQKTAFETLKANYESQLKQGQYNSLRDEVRRKASELNVSNIPIWDDVVAGISVDDGTTAENLLESVKSSYEAKLKAYVGDGAAPYRGDGTQKPAEITVEDRAKRAKEDADRVRKS